MYVDRMEGKADRTQDMLKRKFESREPELWKDLYVYLVRPYLDFFLKSSVNDFI